MSRLALLLLAIAIVLMIATAIVGVAYNVLWLLGVGFAIAAVAVQTRHSMREQ